MHAIHLLGKDIKTNVPPYEAQTLQELAGIIKIDPIRLEETISVFNNAVEDGKFDPSKLDGKCTRGVIPPKSNWALKIDKPPFYCFPVQGTVQFTWGGVASDRNGRVCDADGAPIEGLYAAGETVGLFYHHFTPGTAVLSALTYGRISGIESVRWLAGE